MRAAVPALLGLLGVARGLAYELGLPSGRVVHHQMAATAREKAGVDVSAVFATTLAAFHLQQQRSVATWDLILQDYEDELEPDTEDDEMSRAGASWSGMFATSAWSAACGLLPLRCVCMSVSVCCVLLLLLLLCGVGFCARCFQKKMTVLLKSV